MTFSFASRLEESLNIILNSSDGHNTTRSLIFNLATSGKLETQFPHEAHPNALFEQIDEEALVQDVVPGWLSLDLASCAQIYNGNSTSAAEKASMERNRDGMNYIATKDVGYGFQSIRYDTGLRTGTNQSNFKIAPKDSILICLEGGSAGKKMGIVERQVAFGNKLFAVVCRAWIRPEYLMMYFLSSHFQNDFRKQLSGIIGGISKSKFSNIRIPVPPLEEQNRIIAKAELLITIADELEHHKKHRISLQSFSRRSAIDAMLSTQIPEKLNVAWKRIESNWNAFVDSSSSIEALRGFILDLAVTGRLLSSSSPTDNSMTRNSDLEETNWAKFAPANWSLTTLGDACLKISDGTHKTPTYQDSGVPFLSIKDISGGRIDFSKTRFISQSEHEALCKRIKPTPGDVLFCRIGTLGKAITIDIDREFSIFVSLGLLRVKQHLNPKFLEMTLNSPISHQQFESIKAGGSHTQKLNLGAMNKYVMWYPNLRTQAEIVRQVSDLMEICNRLELSMNLKVDLSEEFANSLVFSTT